MTMITIKRRRGGLLLPSLFLGLAASSSSSSSSSSWRRRRPPALVASVGAFHAMTTTTTTSSSRSRSPSPIVAKGRSRRCVDVDVVVRGRGMTSSTALRLGDDDDVVVVAPTRADGGRQSQQQQQQQPNMKKKDLRTLQRFLEVECWKLPQIRSLDRTLLAVSDACKQINRIVQRAQTDDLYGAAIDPTTGLVAELNVQGEAQQQLDVLCNTLMLRAFCGASNDAICAVASEEEPLPRSCADVMGYDVSTNSLVGGNLVNSFRSGDYVAVFDPIDGSKNIDSSLPVGTVFGIYRRPEGGYTDNKSPSDSDQRSYVDLDGFLQRGTKMVAAGYCLYSATTVLVLTLGSGVHGFTLDPDRQIFLQTHPNMRVPDVGSLYSFNEANSRDYSEPVQKFLKNMKETGKMGGKKVTARYVGALVADVHNVLINGGIYGYPATRDNPNGKLRLLYESAPMAMIMEQAGGAGSTGYGRILDVLPPQPRRRKNKQDGAASGDGSGSSEEDEWNEEAGRGIHVRVPTFLGSVENVFELDQFHKYYGEEGG